MSPPAGPSTAQRVLVNLAIIGVAQAAGYFLMKYLVDLMDPAREEKKRARSQAQRVLARLGLKNVELEHHELVIAADLVHPDEIKVSWDNIGGLDHVIAELQELVVLPFRRPELFAARGGGLLRPPKGVLFYGPPGCGKTLLAKAVAKECGCRFLNLRVSSLMDKWYGESQKLVNALFSLASKLQPIIIFIDEIDAFLRERQSGDHESSAIMKAQFMSLWDGLTTDEASERIVIIGATNRPRDVDPAILRRMPQQFRITPPDAKQRERILEVILKGERLDATVNLRTLAAATGGLTGSQLNELCRAAAMLPVREFLREENRREQATAAAAAAMASEKGGGGGHGRVGDAVAAAAATTTPVAAAAAELRPLRLRDFIDALGSEGLASNVSFASSRAADTLDDDQDVFSTPDSAGVSAPDPLD